MLKSLTTPCTTPSLSFLAKHLVGVSCVAVLGVPGREVYYLYMASIVGKRQGNATYYYLVESARVDGKPRIVSQQYLGSAAEVMAKLAGGGPGEPVRVQYRSFGDLAAVWSVLTQIGVAAIIDGVAPRRSDAAVSAGTYIALACANRIVAPCSKLAFADWWATSLSFLAKHLVGVSCVAVLGVPGREVYYLYMASIVGKRQGNATYYYLVESARVDGKPRIVSQQYLGSAAEVMAKLAGGGPGEPVRVQYRSFGDLAAVWS